MIAIVEQRNEVSEIRNPRAILLTVSGRPLKWDVVSGKQSRSISPT
jgi:hypothetical protein